jgi:hypothetical protein
VAHETGNNHRAVELLDASVRLCRDIGHSYALADVLNHLGQCYAALGDTTRAREVWSEAADLYAIQLRGRAQRAVGVRLLTLERIAGPHNNTSGGRT